MINDGDRNGPTMTIATTQFSDLENADALHRLFEREAEEPIERQDMPTLAGPNNAIQILFDQAEWLYFFGGIFAPVIWESIKNKLLDKAVDRGMDAGLDSVLGIFKRKEKPLDEDAARKLFEEVLDKILKAQRKHNSVVVGLPFGTPGSRHIGVELPLLGGDDHEEARTKVERIFEQMVLCSGSIRQFLRDYPQPQMPYGTSQNSDCSMRIRLSPKGDLRLRFMPDGVTQKDAVFGPDTYEVVDKPSGLDIGENGQIIGEPDDALGET